MMMKAAKLGQEQEQKRNRAEAGAEPGKAVAGQGRSMAEEGTGQVQGRGWVGAVRQVGRSRAGVGNSLGGVGG